MLLSWRSGDRFGYEIMRWGLALSAQEMIANSYGMENLSGQGMITKQHAVFVKRYDSVCVCLFLQNID